MAVQRMFTPMDHPILFVGCSLVMFWFTAWMSASWRAGRGQIGEEVRGFLAILLGAALTLLGLIIAFIFSMAVSRYDQRKNYEEQEANAIGTEYARAEQLPPEGAAKVHALLKSYVDQRILFYKTRSEDELRRVIVRTAQLQTELWSAASTSSAALQAPMAVFVLGGMNDVLNSQGYTQAAWWNRIPGGAWMLLIAISILCNVLIGFDAPSRKVTFLIILPIALSISFFFIADIDSPRHGLIRVHPQNLESLAESLHSQ
jgi:hypothetical protein